MQTTKLFGLGGMQEIGKATIVVEHEDEIVIVDSGIKFTNSMETGVQAIIPDYSYLKENQDKIQGLFITHGHEDHMGGIPYLLKQVNIPVIYAPKIAIALIKGRLEEHGIKTKTEFVETTKELNVKTKHFEIDSWTAQHSVPDAFGIRVKTPNGSIFYTGDFRFDYTPLGNQTDFTKLKQIGDEGLTVFLSDSTNSFSQHHSPTEKDILIDIEKFTKESKGKVILTTFASQLTRIQTLIKMAERLNRKVLPLGRSMIKNIDFARQVGYIDVADSTFIDKRDVNKYPDNEIFVLTTGSQGEERAGLARMAMGKHAQIKLKHGDTVIFSSSPIPGNRVKVELLVNQLYKLGVDIKEHRVDGMLHVSGHAYKDEHIKIFELVRSKYFIPFHGSYRMSAVHGVTAVQSGTKAENVIILANGEAVELNNGVVTRSDKFVDPGPVYIDSNNPSKANGPVIRQRADLGENGFVNVTACVDKKNNNIIGRTRIISRGAMYAQTSKELMMEIQRLAHGAILSVVKNKKDWTKSDIKKEVAKRIEPYFYKVKRRNPLVVTSILDYAK